MRPRPSPRFQEQIKAKLALTFVIVLLPLLAGEMLALHSLGEELHEAAEQELSNSVTHLYTLCAIQSHSADVSGLNNAAVPDSEVLAPIQNLIHTFHVGSAGFAYVMDCSGNLLVHPAMEGRNVAELMGGQGSELSRTLCEAARKLGPGDVGTLRLDQQAAGGDEIHRLVLKLKYFERWRWIIVAGSDEQEVYASLGRIEYYSALMVGMSLVLVVALTLALNRIITRPLDQVSAAASKMAAGDLDHSVQIDTRDEFGALAAAFNAMADQVRDKTENLENTVNERTEALRESRERYRSLVESTVDAIVTTDKHGTITFVNKSFEKISGYSRDEVLGTPIWSHYPEGRERAVGVMELLRTQGQVASLEMSLRGRDRVVPIHTSASILRDAQGEERGTLGIFSDMTARRRLEAELAEAQANLVQTMKLRALGDLVSGVAHEVNNPLMASSTILHVMKRSTCKADCPNERRLEVLVRCNERIARIVDHLREFSRQAEMHRRPISINEPIDNALVITGQQLLNMQIEIRKQLDPDLPPVMADANHLEQVFLDIIANARDAMEELEQRVLTIRSYSCHCDGRPSVVVTISDTGPGIPAEVRDKIFEPFFTTKEVGKGTGLGLAICYGIIEEHGGTIRVEDQPEGGTTLRIALPTAGSDDAVTAEA